MRLINLLFSGRITGVNGPRRCNDSGRRPAPRRNVDWRPAGRRHRRIDSIGTPPEIPAAVRRARRDDRGADGAVGTPVLRVAVAVVFVWFGSLEIFDVSPAADLVAATVYVVPRSCSFLPSGSGRCSSGCVCSTAARPTRRLPPVSPASGRALAARPPPGVVYVAFPYALTVEGQYTIKNRVIIGAAPVIGGTVRNERLFDR